jgi:hypothetical protein
MAQVVIRTEPGGQPRKGHSYALWISPLVLGVSGVASQQSVHAPTVENTQVVASTKVPSQQSVPSPVIAGPLTVTGVPSQQSVIAPAVTAPEIIGVPLPVTWTPRAFHTPSVVGPVGPVSPVPSQQALYAPTMDVSQTIAPSAAVPSQQAFFAPDVSNVQVISPAKVPSQQSFLSPHVSGSSQFITPIGSLPSQQFVPAPDIEGGVYSQLNPAIDGLQIFLGGVEVTKYTLLLESNVPSTEPTLGSGGVAQSCTIQSQVIGRWTATFKLFDNTGTISPSLAQTVQILDYGVKIFAGCIQSISINRELSTASAITFEITATDKSGICDHRVVAGTPDYPAGSDVAQTILDIVTNYLNGEGITTNNVPTDGSLGTLATDEQFNFNTVTQAFDQICTDNGLLWFVDVNGDLNVCTEDTFPEAPFDLTETSGNWRNLAVSLNLLNYRNKQYVVSNLSTLPGSATSGDNSGGQGGGGSSAIVSETYVWNFASPGVPNPGIVMQVINGTPTLVGVQVQLPIQTIQSIVVSGGFTPQTVYELSNFNGQTSQASNDYLWSYLSSTDPAGLNTIADTQAFPEILLPLGATVTINYVPGTNNAAAQTGAAIVAVTPPGAPSVGGLGTCGSGTYEAVEQVQNVATQDGLQAIANAILSRYGGVPTTIDFETDYPGLRPGQVITINIPGTYAPTAQLLITQVQGTHMSGNIGYGMSKGTVNGSFRWAVECSSILDPGNWVKWYENLIERTQNALPVYQYEEADFAIGLGGGGNIGNGLVQANPYIVKRTGLLFDMHAAAAIPPTGQDLVITFYRNGILIPGSVTIPGGSFANTDNVFTFPATTSLYVFANPPNGPNDIITIAANYRVTGANPTPALNVTAFLRWRI